MKPETDTWDLYNIKCILMKHPLHQLFDVTRWPPSNKNWCNTLSTSNKCWRNINSMCWFNVYTPFNMLMHLQIYVDATSNKRCCIKHWCWCSIKSFRVATQYHFQNSLTLHWFFPDFRPFSRPFWKVNFSHFHPSTIRKLCTNIYAFWFNL